MIRNVLDAGSANAKTADWPSYGIYFDPRASEGAKSRRAATESSCFWHTSLQLAIVVTPAITIRTDKQQAVGATEAGEDGGEHAVIEVERSDRTIRRGC
jgi:hypothetical protein